jgi:ribosomal protein L11 methyltransferase
VLDIGTGSGVLAIAAARLGFAPVLALDHDPLSVEAARENAQVNGVEIAVERFDLRGEPLPHLAGTVVLANLLLPLLLELSRTVAEAPSELVASGLLREQADEVAEVFRTRFQLHERRRLQSGEWAALWLSPA